MGLLSRLFHMEPRLGPEFEERLQRLSEMSPPPMRNPHRASRYVAVGVETAGLDLRHDRPLSIGAVAVERCAIDLADCFEVVLRQPESSSGDSILGHRIGGERQPGGEDPAESLLQFLEYVRRCPLVAFHAEFNQTIVDRTLRETLGTISHSPSLDLAELLSALYPSNENKTMDDWLGKMNIRKLAQHGALANAMAAAQLLQVCLYQAETLEMISPAHLLETQRAQHWLGKR